MKGRGATETPGRGKNLEQKPWDQDWGQGEEQKGLVNPASGKPHNNLYDGSSTLTFTSQLGKLRLMEVEQGTQGHRANSGQRRTSTQSTTAHMSRDSSSSDAKDL